MIRTMRAALAALALALSCAGASAQSAFPTPGGGYVDGHALMCPNGSVDFQGRPIMVPCSSTVPLQIAGSFSASLAGFQPTPSFSQLAAADAASHAVAVPSGADDVIQNTSANDAYCNVGATPTATAANILVAAKSSVPFHNGGAFAQIACISPSSTLAINIAGGVGLWTASGGGGGGSSGSSGPLGVQAISNSQAVNPATSSLWTVAQGGAALSATNGIFSNLLQGNAILSATNPIFIAPSTSAGMATSALQTTGNTSLASILSAQATAALQTTGNTSLASIATNTTGAATSALQTTGNTSLASIVTNTALTAAGTTATSGSGVQGMTGGVPVPTSTAVNVTPTDCSQTATGSSQTMIAASAAIHGFSIANIDPTTAGGEPVWISFTGAAVAGAKASFPLAAPTAITLAGMGSYTTPVGFGTNLAVTEIATSGHLISCTRW
jgi:hypothetical protein